MYSADLVCHFRFQELAVEASDVGDAFALRANGFAGAGVGAVTNVQLVLGNQCRTNHHSPIPNVHRWGRF